MLSRASDLTDQLHTPPGRTPVGMTVVGLGDISHAASVEALARGGLPPRVLQRVRDYVLAHLADDLTNGVLARLAGLSPFHFPRAFKQSTGVSPQRFVRESRVERVKHLLVETDLPIAQIALAAGFADQSHCSRRFHEIAGATPSRFRWLNR
jgi:AraC family transcriptional regulator